MIVNAQFRRKDESIELEPCSINKVIELPKYKFDMFQNNLLSEYSFLSENRDYMGFDEYGLRHCMLVLCENQDDGILVDAQGSGYARYSSYLPCARQLVDILPYQSLKDFNKLMASTVESSVKSALENQRDGMYSIKLSSLPSPEIEPMFSYSVFSQMISERAEFKACETFLNEVAVQIEPELAVEHSEEYEAPKLRELTREEVDIKLAKHVLWLNDASGGEQADFTNCIVRDMNLSNHNLLNAHLSNGTFVDCDFSNAQLCFAMSNGATFNSCDFSNAVAEECELIDSAFINCKMADAILTNTNFDESSFSECDLDYPKEGLPNMILE